MDFVPISKAIKGTDFSHEQVRRLCMMREVVAHKTAGGQWRVSKASLKDWLQRQKPIVGMALGFLKDFEL